MATPARWKMVFLLGLLSAGSWAAEVPLEERVRQLEQRLEEPGEPRAASGAPLLTLGGQYRINAYSVDNDTGGDKQTASRLRLRQNIDLQFDRSFKTHVQLELGHTNDNLTTTAGSSRGTRLAVRHAVLDYTLDAGSNLQAGIVPLSDRFGDTQFSSDWDYNPVALGARIPLGAGSLRAFAGNLAEGDEALAEDDFVHYQLDYRLPLGPHALDLALTVADVSDNGVPPQDHRYVSYGLGGEFKLGRLVLKTFALAARTDKALLGTADDAKGTAVKLELTGPAGRGEFGLLVTHATGESDGSGFLPIMALARTNGYWGYTGILTIQGPTDTGFDGDSVNMSNNGYGLTTVQARYTHPITERLKAYVAAGWFGRADAPAGRGDEVGTDILLMGTYRLHKYLSLDFGAAYARIEDAVSGYANGVIGGAGFNQAAGVSRDKSAVFTRLQAEF